jgi:glycosyltransferase involved in cell wall biosynthesis
MEQKRKVSVVMCTYNGQRFVSEQLISILNQTYPIHEIVIQDDCSTDITWSILSEFQANHNIIRCFRNKENIGVHKNFVTAYLKTTGDYIAPCDQDDIWLPEKIEKLVSIIGENAMAYSQSKVKFTESESIGSFSLRNPFVSIFELIWDNRILGHACLYNRSTLDYFEWALKLFDSCCIQSNAHDHIVPLYAYSLDSYIITKDILQVWRRHENVCNLEFISGKTTNKTLVNGYKKFIKTSISLIKGQKSIAIEETFLARSELLNFIFLKNKFKLQKKFKLYIKLAKYISKQSFLSYLVAGYICVRVRKTNNKLSLRKKIGEISFSFRLPFTYWYDMHNLKYL